MELKILMAYHQRIIQVMLFKDRLEVWSPGELRYPLTLEKLLRPHHSLPVNPLLADPLYLCKYIEKAGSGTLDVISLCLAAGLPRPEFSIDVGCFITTIWRKSRSNIYQVEAPVEAPVELYTNDVLIINALKDKEIGRNDLLKILGHSQKSGSFKKTIFKLLKAEIIAYTIPEKPNSRLQKYQITEKGRELLK